MRAFLSQMGMNMITEKELPKEYKQRMQALLGEEYPLYIQSLREMPYSGLRVNTLKLTPTKFCELPFGEFQKIPWIDTGFYIGEGVRMSKSPYYYAGLYYLQEPSAMTPALISKAKPGDRVLDLCAAPGGKSTQLAAMLQGKGVLVSNDLSNSRAKALLKNLEVSGVGNVMLTCEEPAKLANVYNEYFDKVLVDAPCSGEGMFRRDNAVFHAYLGRGSEYFVPIQKDILKSAAKMVKPGGYLVYSTCTYSVLEDEEVLIDFLLQHPDFELDAIEEYENFTDSKILPGTKRLLPHKLKGEGHFISRLKKKGDADSMPNPSSYRKVAKLPSCVTDFLKHLDLDLSEHRFFVNREYIYYLPEDNFVAEKLRYLRTGLLLGRINYTRFEPSQALAMFLKCEEWDKVLNLSIKDARVIKYLKGETLDLSSEEEIRIYFDRQKKDDGYRLVCVDSYPLGFAKQSGLRLKNKYYPGWRMN